MLVPPPVMLLIHQLIINFDKIFHRKRIKHPAKPNVEDFKTLFSIFIIITCKIQSLNLPF